LAFWIADTPEKAKLMLTNGHTCNVCKAGKIESCDVMFSDLGNIGEMRDIPKAREQWEAAVKVYETAPSNASGLVAANEVMKTEYMKFVHVQPILYYMHDFSFKSLAFEEMHTLEGLSKWIVYFTMLAIQDKHSNAAFALKKIDSLASSAVQDMSPLLRPLRDGFTSMTFGTYQEWKTVIVLLLPLVSMTCDGYWLEETLASYQLMRQLIRRKFHTPSTIGRLRGLIRQTKELMTAHFVQYSPSSMNFPKFHDLEHLCDSIEDYGMVFNASAQAEDCSHIENSKSTYRQTNRKNDVSKQMTEVTIL
jgi:hypothetical protein